MWARRPGRRWWLPAALLLAGLICGCWKMAEIGGGAPDGGDTASASDTDTAPGNLLWAVRAGGTAGDFGLALSAYPDGSSVISGHIMATATFGQGDEAETTLVPQGSSIGDVFIARYHPDGTLDWARSFGGETGDSGLAVAALPDGSAAVAGYFRGTALFGEGEANETTLVSNDLNDAYSKDAFVARFAADGDLEWAVRAGGDGEDEVRGIAAFDDGALAVTGRFADVATFGPGEPGQQILTSGSITFVGTNTFIARYNPDGTLAWARMAGSESSGSGNGVAVAPDGAVLVTGELGSSTTFGYGEPGQTTLTTGGYGDVFVARLAGDGTLEWATSASGTGRDSGRAVAVRGDGKVLTTGKIGSTTTFGPGEPGEVTLEVPSERDVFVACHHADGTLAWVRQIVTAPDDDNSAVGRGITALPDDGALVTGWFTGIAELDGPDDEEATLTSANGQDAFLARYDEDGELVWARRIGGSGMENRGYGVAPAPDDTLLVTGRFWNTLTFEEDENVIETTLTSAGGNDIFLARYLL